MSDISIRVPAIAQNGVNVYLGDCREVLRDIPEGSVNCCVTSPPYWGLRDYGTGRWEGGDPECDHVEAEIRIGKGLAEWSAENARGGGHKAGAIEQKRDLAQRRRWRWKTAGRRSGSS